MIIVFYLEDMSSKSLGEFFDSIEEFALSKFSIKIEDNGVIYIDETKHTTTYALGSGKNHYTKEEAIKHFIHSRSFLQYAKSYFWSIYKAQKIS